MGTGLILFAMLDNAERTPRSQPGRFFVSVLSISMLSRIGEARVSNGLRRLLTYGVPLGAVLVGTSLILSISREANGKSEYDKR
jgi:hypothetical protein